MTVISFIKQNLSDVMDIAPILEEETKRQPAKKIQLQLHANAIASIPMSFFTVSLCTRLVQLDLSSNRLSNMSWLVNAPILPALLLLNLSNNGIERLPPKSLGRCPALRKLNLSYNRIRELSVFQEVNLSSKQI
jgi:Leucine-rich repeat (LRR) protein